MKSPPPPLPPCFRTEPLKHHTGISLKRSGGRAERERETNGFSLLASLQTLAGRASTNTPCSHPSLQSQNIKTCGGSVPPIKPSRCQSKWSHLFPIHHNIVHSPFVFVCLQQNFFSSAFKDLLQPVSGAERAVWEFHVGSSAACHLSRICCWCVNSGSL